MKITTEDLEVGTTLTLSLERDGVECELEDVLDKLDERAKKVSEDIVNNLSLDDSQDVQLEQDVLGW